MTSAVQWLVNQLEKYEDYAKISYRCLGEIEIALEMEAEQQLPQQEISDEEIEKRVKEVGAMGEYYKMGYRDAIKWYREQLKCKGNDSKSKN